MNELRLQNFSYGDQDIRVVEINGVPWFSGKDVAKVLGYSNTRDALQNHVDTEDQRVVLKSQCSTLDRQSPTTAGFPVNFGKADFPNRGLTLINESGLYSLILSSRLPTAKQFKRWVTIEVLPAIKKYGAYLTPEATEQMLYDTDYIIRLATILKEERERRAKLERENAVLLPKGKRFRCRIERVLR